MNRMIALTIALFSVFALCAGDISLPAPQKNGGMTLTETLASRRSVRKYTAEEVSMQALANVLWCANGISSPDGKRTAPSAMNRQEIIIYVTMKSGSFRYDAATHKLVRVSDADLRPQAGRYAAPVYLLLVADTQRQRSEIYAAVDTGYVSQNIYLGATANSLGTCAMGSITDRKKISEVLQLGKNRLMLSHPLGTPEK